MVFCQNKYDIFRLDNFEYGNIEPLFVLDLNVNENDTSEFFYIDYNTFDPDTPTPRMFDTVPLVWICNPAQLSNRICNSHNNVLE